MPFAELFGLVVVGALLGVIVGILLWILLPQQRRPRGDRRDALSPAVSWHDASRTRLRR